MLNRINLILAIAALWLPSISVFADEVPPGAPEIDGGGGIIALSLVCGVVVLIREYKRRK